MCFDNYKKSENNGMEEIGLVTPTPGPQACSQGGILPWLLSVEWLL